MKFKVGDKVEYIGDYNMFEGMGTVIKEIGVSYRVEASNGKTTCMEESLKKVDNPIQNLKDEISEKQRELAEMIEESGKEGYHFEENEAYTWTEISDKLKEIDNGKGFICGVERDLDTNSLMINLEINYDDKVSGKIMLKED